MSDFLKRLVITLLYSSIFLFFTRILSIWIALFFTHTPFALESRNDLTLITLSSAEQLAHVTTIADIIFALTVILAGSLILARTLLLNDLTRNPRVLVKVIHYNLMGWLEDGKQMYPSLFGWGTLLWVATLVLLKNSLSNLTPFYITLTAALFSIYFTYKVFAFLDKHINDMISYLYGEKTK